MAQPQHTRNDPHLPFISFEESIFEAYTETLIVDPSALNGNPWLPGSDLDTFLDSYDTVRLPEYRQYFHNELGQGLADFSNKNFVTQDTNFNDPRRACSRYDYQSPRIEETTSTFEMKRVTYRVREANGYRVEETTLPVERFSM